MIKNELPPGLWEFFLYKKKSNRIYLVVLHERYKTLFLYIEDK